MRRMGLGDPADLECGDGDGAPTEAPEPAAEAGAVLRLRRSMGLPSSSSTKIGSWHGKGWGGYFLWGENKLRRAVFFFLFPFSSWHWCFQEVIYLSLPLNVPLFTLLNAIFFGIPISGDTYLLAPKKMVHSFNSLDDAGAPAGPVGIQLLGQTPASYRAFLLVNELCFLSMV